MFSVYVEAESFQSLQNMSDDFDLHCCTVIIKQHRYLCKVAESEMDVFIAIRSPVLAGVVDGYSFARST